MGYRIQDKAKSEFKNHIDVYGLEGKKEDDPEELRENTYFDNTVETKENFFVANWRLLLLILGVGSVVTLIVLAILGVI